MIFVNFKTYKEGTASHAVELIQQIVSVQTETKVPIIPVVQAVDARLCVNTSGYSVWMQHIDSAQQGQSTGWITVESAAESGVSGTFLNHSEHKMQNNELRIVNEKCRGIGLETMIFASDMKELGEVVKLKPSYAAYEPPELIASPDTSVAKAKPDVIREAANVCKKAGVKLIIGAGVKSKDDVATSLKLGAIGVAVSSAVVLAEDPRSILEELARGFGS